VSSAPVEAAAVAEVVAVAVAQVADRPEWATV
jgi:hypothetical protein